MDVHGVGGGHGRAVRLRVEDDIDVEQFDRVVANGGDPEDVQAVRMRLGNRLLGPSRFGKMFPDSDPFRPSDTALVELGRAMTSLENPAVNNSDIPAGFTYLGQFIDHDITRDETEGFPEIDDPELIEQGRRVTLDLDSLYGQGPKRQPELYNKKLHPSQARFRLGLTTPTPDVGGGRLPNDLPRRANKEAVIPDDRNDENTIVAQTHLAFLKFHNKVMDTTIAETEDDGSATFTQADEDRRPIPFNVAKRSVRWHYQWLVLNDFLPQLVDRNVLDDIRANGRRHYDFSGRQFRDEPFMPLEFSGAAYRLGHSMIRDGYNFNRVFSDPLQVPGASQVATLGLLFTFTGKGGMFGSPTLPSNWIIDWRRFFPVDDPALLNFTRAIDITLAESLRQLPVPSGQPAVLAVRNLLRGSRVGLPTGQDVAQEIGATTLTPAQIASGHVREIVRKHKFHQQTPLWYYILKEAEVQGEGMRLGEVGSRILGEVFVGLLEGDPNSFLSRQPDWTPTLSSSIPGASPGDFKMADLLRFVNEINPIG